MELIALILFFCCLSVIVFQDLKFRQIHILAVLILLLASFCLVTGKLTYVQALKAAFYNCCFFGFTFIVLVLYMSLKNKRYMNPFSNYFGLGDLLFYLCISPLFALKNYIVFFILSMLFGIALFFVFRKSINKETIPLAGYSSVLLMLICAADLLFGAVPFTLIGLVWKL